MLFRISRKKIFFILTLLLIIFLGITTIIAQTNTNSFFSNYLLSQTERAKQGLINHFEELTDRALQWGEVIANREILKTAVINNDFNAIQEIIEFYSSGMNFLSIADANGIILIRSYNDIQGDDVSSHIDVSRVLQTGKPSTSISIVPSTGSLAANASTPIFYGDILIGVVNCNFDLRNVNILDIFKIRTNSEASIFLGNEKINTTILCPEGNRIIGAVASEHIIERILHNGELYTGIIEIYGRRFGGHYSPIILNDKIIGMLFTGIDLETFMGERRAMNFWIFFASILSIVISILFLTISIFYSKTLQILTSKTILLDNMKQLMQSMDTLILITELESDKILFANEKMKSILNITNDIIGTECWKVLTAGADRRCIFCPKNDPSFTTDKTSTWEFRSPLNNKYYKITSKHIDWPDGSKVFLEQINDITELKESIIKIKEADKYIQLLLDSTPISCILWNNNLEVVDCNNETLKLFGIKSKNEASNIFTLFSPELQPNKEKSEVRGPLLLKKTLEDGYLRLEWMFQSANGESLPCEITLVRIKYKGGYLIAGYGRDLSKEKAHLNELNKSREAAEAASRAKSVFLATMSHEIRTPMNSIIGFTELARKETDVKKTGEYLEKIANSSDWLLTIINNILDLSKIEAGKMELELIPFDLYNVFEHCRAVMMPNVVEKGISLHCYAEPSIGKKLLGDPLRLKQALINLLSNAVKFTSIGTIKLLASIKSYYKNSVVVAFEIRDSGIGMSKEKIEKIFAPFIQADNSITRKYGGTGLGLTITKNLIEMMGGSLKVESTPNVGTNFYFELPFETVNDTADLPQDKILLHNLEEPNFKGDVLVFEDNIMNQQVISQYLGKAGLTVTIAENGEAGINILEKRFKKRKKPFDLILMDIHMPVMNGLEAAEKITNMGVKTPIVAMTANVMTNELQFYKEKGFSDLLGKPFKPQDLWKCLIKHLSVTGYTSINKKQQAEEENKMLHQLKINFVKEHHDIIKRINQAVNDGDFKLAHRLAHSLKSNAGQIEESRLKEAAETVEAMLSGSENRLTKKQNMVLEAELNHVLTKLTPLLKETDNKKTKDTPKKEKTIELLNKLEEMLTSRNPMVMNFIEEIRTIPKTEELVKFTENFEFKKAVHAIGELRKSIETET